MKKTTILMFLAMIAVSSAAICCNPGSLGADERTDLPEKACDSKATSNLKPTVAPKTQAKPSKATPVKKDGASTSGTKPDPTTKVLVLNVGDEIDKRLSLEWKLDENLDFVFVSMSGEEKNTVKAHKSIVLKYCPKIKKIMNSFEERGIKRDMFPLYYPVSIIKSLLTLMYEQIINVNISDFDKIMEAAKSLEMDGLIGVLQDDVHRK